MADVNGPVCLNHPDTPAAARCAACGKAICNECTVTRNAHSYCSTTCADNAGRSQILVDMALAGKKRADSKARVRLVVGTVILLAILIGLYCFYTSNRSVNKSFLKQLGKELDSTLHSSKNAIQKSVPADSSYRKSREGLVK